MKKLLVSFLAVFVTSGVAFAQEASQPSIFADSYVGIESDLDGAVDFTVGTGVTAFNQESYVEFTYSDGVTNSYALGAGAVMDLNVVELDTNVAYSWDNDTTNLVGWGDTNTWGDVTVNPTITAKPGIIGGEYASVGGTVAVNNFFDYGIEGGEIALGYKHELGAGAHVDLSYGWDVNSDWEVGEGAMKLGVGFKF